MWNLQQPAFPLGDSGSHSLTAEVTNDHATTWLFRNNIQFCAGEETKQLGDFTTSAPGGAQSEEGCTAGKQLGHGQMGGCEVGQEPGAHVRAHHLRPSEGLFQEVPEREISTLAWEAHIRTSVYWPHLFNEI